MEIDWPWAKLRTLESFHSDDDYRRAGRHTTHQTLRHIDIRTERFLAEPPGVQRATLLLLRRDSLNHEPGNRGVASSVLVTGLANVATVITAVVAVILAAYLGFVDQLTPQDARANQDFLTTALLWVAAALMIVLFAVTVVWFGGGQRDRRRAMATLWHEIFTQAQNDKPDDTAASETDALRAWLERYSVTPETGPSVYWVPNAD
jgi:MFS family permease